MRNLNVLLVGESWFIHSIHQKGFDTFHTAEYQEGASHFIDGLRERGHQVEFIPSHGVATAFSTTIDALAPYDVVILSDVGSNTFLLAPDTFARSIEGPNRLHVLRDYVLRGGAVLMIGGYMSFAGIDGKARYGKSPLSDVLPVVISDGDDRVEAPEGIRAEVIFPSHPAIVGVPEDWPALLGYNKLVAKADAEVLVATADGDPLLTVGSAGAGRSAAFASDLAPHWAPPQFVSWDGYFPLWETLLQWLGAAATSADVEVATAAAPTGADE